MYSPLIQVKRSLKKPSTSVSWPSWKSFLISNRTCSYWSEGKLKQKKKSILCAENSERSKLNHLKTFTSSRCHLLIIRCHVHSQPSHMKAFLWWSFSQLCSITFNMGFIPSSLFWFFIRPCNTSPDSSVVGCQKNLL